MFTMKTRPGTHPAALAAITLAAGMALAPAAHAETAGAQVEVLHVTMTPTCGCCGAWAELAEAHGLDVEITLTKDYASMKEAGEVPEGHAGRRRGAVA